MKLLLPTILICLSLTLTSCAQTNYNNILVTKVVDGDTLRLANGELVRLIGIDAPEMYESDKLHRDAQRTGKDINTITAMGREAYKFVRKLVEGKHTQLEFDLEKRDKYGRLLAYIYLPDGTFVNAEIVKQGYASPMSIPPNLRYADLFQRLYQQAQEKRIGLWK